MVEVKKIIEEVINDLANNFDIKDITLKVQIISKLLKNEEFSKWVNSEFIDGYKSTEGLPTYRILNNFFKATIHVNNGYGIIIYSNYILPIESLDRAIYKSFSTTPVLDNITTIQNIINRNDHEICCYVNANEKYHLQKLFEQGEIYTCQRVIPKISFISIIDKIKSKLLDIFMDLDGKLFDNELEFDVMKKKEEIASIINNNINAAVYVAQNSTANISDSNIIIGNSNNITINNKDKLLIEDILKQIENIISSYYNEIRNDVDFEINKIREELKCDLQRTNVLRSAFNAIKGIAISICANELTPLVEKAIELIK